MTDAINFAFRFSIAFVAALLWWSLRLALWACIMMGTASLLDFDPSWQLLGLFVLSNVLGAVIAR